MSKVEITIAGKKLSPAEVEAYLAKHGGNGPDWLGTDEMNAIMRRVELKVPPPANESKEQREFRIAVTKDIAKIHAAGGSVEYVAD